MAVVISPLRRCATPVSRCRSGPNAEVILDGLHESKNSAAITAWAMPGADRSAFTNTDTDL